MIKGMAGKEQRSSKRNMTMLPIAFKNEGINSAKELKRYRSNKNIDLTSFVENKNEKIKHIDEKLDVHQSEITRNHNIIEELNNNFVNLKQHLEREKENCHNQERKNRLLREEIERTSKVLRTKNTKIEEHSRKISELEKENEGLKQVSVRNQQLVKTVNGLRGRVATLQEQVGDLKHSIGEKDKEMIKQKEKLYRYEQLKCKEEDLNGQVLAKDVLIGNLRQAINELNVDKNRESAQKTLLQNQVKKLEAELEANKEASKELNKTLAEADQKIMQLRTSNESLESERKDFSSRMKSRQQEESSLRSEFFDVKNKLKDMTGQAEERNKELAKKESRISKLTQKINELENVMADGSKQRDKLRLSEGKVSELRSQVKAMEKVYHNVVPQIQCPFGHELKNPVTIIPCGHNYCLGCKKGYHKECMQCNGKLKIEAVYRNELMDDIIGMAKGVKSVLEILK